MVDILQMAFGSISLVLIGSVISYLVMHRRSDRLLEQKLSIKVGEEQLRLAKAAASQLMIYRKLLDHTSDGIVLMDTDYLVVEINKSFLDMFEYTEGELKGKPLYQFILSENELTDSRQEALIRTEHDAYEAVRVKKNGDTMIVKISSFKLELETDEGPRQYICSHYTDVTESVEKEQKITELAYYDALTSLPNRYLLESRAAEIQLMGISNQFSFVFFDLNGFKHINDTLGHEYGDALLIAFSKRVRRNIKQDDFLARIGGDEFVLLLPDTPREMAYHVVERIHQVLEQPFVIKGQRVFVGAAAGITGYPEDSESVEELQRCADIAMYTAKQQHLPYLYYDQKMRELYRERMSIEQKLIQALKKRDEIVLYYLPVVDISDHSVISFEALCRWNHPEKGLIPSADFIPIAEESQLIYDLGSVVLRKAFKQAYMWKQAGYTFSVTVNLSAKELILPGTMSKIKKLTAQYEDVQQCIEIEITEAVSMLNMAKGKEVVRALKRMGFRVILDDFGTGYSSLNFLRELEIDRLKIDKNLIDDAQYSNATGLIIKGMQHLASVLDVDIIAEGVSSLEQQRILASMGLTYQQGFLYSRPVPAHQVEQVIEELKQSRKFHKNIRAPRDVKLQIVTAETT